MERGLASVWVVDNASADGSADMVSAEYPWVQLIASPENLGFGCALNVVAERSSSEWIAAANADVALRPGALDALVAAGARDPGAAAIAPRLILPDGGVQHSAFGFPTIPFTLVTTLGIHRLSPAIGDRYAIPGYWNKRRARRVPWAVAAFLLVRRAAWDEIGGFDERHWMYAEDLDFGWRLREAGWATRYEPRATVDHESAAATTQLFGKDVAPHWQRSTYGFIARRRGVGHVWAVALLHFAGAVARATVALPRSRGRALAWARWSLVHLRFLRGRGALVNLR